MWLLIQAGIKVNPWWEKGAQVTLFYQNIKHQVEQNMNTILHKKIIR